MKLSRITLTCFVVAAVGGSAAAFTLGQKRVIKQQNKEFKYSVDRLNRTCESKIAAAIDWKTFADEIDKHLDGKLGVSFHGYCAEPLAELTSFCKSDDDLKPTIRAGVERYTCKFGGKGKRGIKLDNKHLTYWVDWKAVNNNLFIKKYLEKNL